MADSVKMSAAERREDRRRRAVLGPLPESFLRIPGKIFLKDPSRNAKSLI